MMDPRYRRPLDLRPIFSAGEESETAAESLPSLPDSFHEAITTDGQAHVTRARRCEDARGLAPVRDGMSPESERRQRNPRAGIEKPPTRP
jgi:hypothetical protein